MMRGATLSFRSIVYHRRASLAMVLVVAVGTAVITGALLVGDSMRGSLREVALERLGSVDFALRSGRFFRAALADDIAGDERFGSRFDSSVPLILLRGAATHAANRSTAHRITVLGVDDRFVVLETADVGLAIPSAGTRQVLLNRPLALQLGAKTGDDILLRVTRPSDVASETLLGRRDETAAAVRFTVAGIVPATGLGQFSLDSKQPLPLNAFVPLDTLQRLLDQPDRANAILVRCDPVDDRDTLADSTLLENVLAKQIHLDDLGLSFRLDETHGYIALESRGFLIEPPVETAAMQAFRDLPLSPSGVLTYLANTIAIQGGPRSIPYSTVAAIDPNTPGLGVTPAPGEIVLNEWTAERLGANLGDGVTLSYYVTGSFGSLSTEEATFVLRGIVPLTGIAADPGFTPTYPGVTDADDMGDWDPPFPVDLTRVGDDDERYWDLHRTTPKAFISLTDGWRMWGQDADRFGRLTSIRWYFDSDPGPPTSQHGAESPSAADQANRGLQSARTGVRDSLRIATNWERQLASRLDPSQLGLRFDAVRERAVEAGGGTTDFGGLFIGFSFFLIVSAVILMILLFRLGVERRAKETGLLLAIGWTPRRIAAALLVEGALLSAVGCAVGLPAALGYAALMIHGLRTWWSAAANAPFLRLHASATSLSIGFMAGMMVSLLAIGWSLRGAIRQSPRLLLGGVTRPIFNGDDSARGRWARWVAGGAVCGAAMLLICTTIGDLVPASAGFFGTGSLLLVAGLAAALHFLTRRYGRHQTADAKLGGQRWPLTRLGLGNAPRQVLRSMAIIGLVASATFVVAALEPFRLTPAADPSDRHSGIGGFSLLAEADVPLPFDLNTADGRERLGFTSSANPALAGIDVVAFRLRPGDETGCTNAYRPNDPRILGATAKMVERGGFAFSAAMTRTPAQESNPWLLLEGTLDDGAIPALADENAVLWQLHLGLGDDLIVRDQRGQPRVLRFVALLKGSALQDEIIIHESNFERLFPANAGYGFHLIDTGAIDPSQIGQVLEAELTRYGFDVTSMADRLAGYAAVQNVFLSAFQMLGGLGLILGAIGLGVVLMRNVWERRSELALMQAVGFSPGAVAWVVFVENAALVIAGSAIGMASAAAAVAPFALERGGSISWVSLIVTVVGAPMAAMAAAGLAMVFALRRPLLPALRRE